jgi:hypothetical protein
MSLQFLECIYLETAKDLKNLIRAKKRLCSGNVGMFSLAFGILKNCTLLTEVLICS